MGRAAQRARTRSAPTDRRRAEQSGYRCQAVSLGAYGQGARAQYLRETGSHESHPSSCQGKSIGDLVSTVSAWMAASSSVERETYQRRASGSRLVFGFFAKQMRIS